MTEFNRCPVCRNTVTPNYNNHIQPHRDNAGMLCPATGHPYTITTSIEEVI